MRARCSGSSSGGFGRDHLAGPLHRLVDEAGQAHRIAPAGLEHLLVGAQDRPEGDVLELDRGVDPAGLPGGGKHHGEMLALGRPHHVDQAPRTQRAHPIAQGRQVGGRIPVAAVLLAHDEGDRLALPPGEARRKHADRALAEPGHAQALQLGHHVREVRVVAALARDVLGTQGDVESTVDLVEVLFREPDELPPEVQGCLVPALQQHHPPPRPLGEGGVAVELGPRRPVEADQLAHPLAQPAAAARVHIGQVLEQHAEGGPPVAHVVLADHPMPLPLEHARQRIADHGRTQVADVHLLRHVGGRVVEDHRLGRARHGGAQPLIGHHAAQLAREKRRLELEVDEPGPRHGHLGQNVVGGEPRDQLGRHLPRVAFQPPGQSHRHVRLVVGVNGAVDGRLGPGRLLAKSGFERGHDALAKRDEWVDHLGSVRGRAVAHGFLLAPLVELSLVDRGDQLLEPAPPHPRSACCSRRRRRRRRGSHRTRVSPRPRAPARAAPSSSPWPPGSRLRGRPWPTGESVPVASVHGCGTLPGDGPGQQHRGRAEQDHEHERRALAHGPIIHRQRFRRLRDATRRRRAAPSGWPPRPSCRWREERARRRTARPSDSGRPGR